MPKEELSVKDVKIRLAWRVISGMWAQWADTPCYGRRMHDPLRRIINSTDLQKKFSGMVLGTHIVNKSKKDVKKFLNFVEKNYSETAIGKRAAHKDNILYGKC